jgi:hypothetical protein
MIFRSYKMRGTWLVLCSLVLVAVLVAEVAEAQGTCRCFFRVGEGITTDKNQCEVGFCAQISLNNVNTQHESTAIHASNH